MVCLYVHVCRYIAEIDENGLEGRIECLPTRGYNTGPMNVTFFTEDRGATANTPEFFPVSYDNKFQPYHVILHAGTVQHHVCYTHGTYIV